VSLASTSLQITLFFCSYCAGGNGEFPQHVWLLSTVYSTDGCSAPAFDLTDGAGSSNESELARPGDGNTDRSSYSDSHSTSGSGGFCVDLIIQGNAIEQVLSTSQVSNCYTALPSDSGPDPYSAASSSKGVYQ